MKPFILAIIMIGFLALIIGIIVILVSNRSTSTPAEPSKRLGSLVQPIPRRSASGYT